MSWQSGTETTSRYATAPEPVQAEIEMPVMGYAPYRVRIRTVAAISGLNSESVSGQQKYPVTGYCPDRDSELSPDMAQISGSGYCRNLIPIRRISRYRLLSRYGDYCPDMDPEFSPNTAQISCYQLLAYSVTGYWTDTDSEFSPGMVHIPLPATVPIWRLLSRYGGYCPDTDLQEALGKIRANCPTLPISLPYWAGHVLLAELCAGRWWKCPLCPAAHRGVTAGGTSSSQTRLKRDMISEGGGTCLAGHNVPPPRPLWLLAERDTCVAGHSTLGWQGLDIGGGRTCVAGHNVPPPRPPQVWPSGTWGVDIGGGGTCVAGHNVPPTAATSGVAKQDIVIEK
ncbi:hypothetical protein C8J57DRAFT_1238816 [Mycena rebaudengoi]|nr:hypothetical protein C8J57DRAFT_1238816 [Mycena rebaudengoi]